jgi:hypothetical protein
MAARDTFSESAAYAGVTTLVVSDAAGDVRLVEAPAGSPVRVTAHVTRGLSGPRRRADRRAGGTLRLSARCPALFDSECGVDYEIAVPPGIGLRVATSAGDAIARHLASREPIELTASAGSVHVDGVRAPSVHLTSTAGDVDARGISAPIVSAESTAGDVRLELVESPRRLTALSTAGNVQLTVPDDVYAVDVQTVSGTGQDIAVRQDPASPRRITAQATAGGVSIHPAP